MRLLWSGVSFTNISKIFVLFNKSGNHWTVLVSVDATCCKDINGLVEEVHRLHFFIKQSIKSNLELKEFWFFQVLDSTHKTRYYFDPMEGKLHVSSEKH